MSLIFSEGTTAVHKLPRWVVIRVDLVSDLKGEVPTWPFTLKKTPLQTILTLIRKMCTNFWLACLQKHSTLIVVGYYLFDISLTVLCVRSFHFSFASFAYLDFSHGPDICWIISTIFQNLFARDFREVVFCPNPADLISDVCQASGRVNWQEAYFGNVDVGCEQLGRRAVVAGSLPDAVISQSCPWQSNSKIFAIHPVSQWNMRLLLSREDMAIGKSPFFFPWMGAVRDKDWWR